MPRYIDADKLIKSVKGNPCVTESIKSYVRASANGIPTADVHEVVHCGLCKNRVYRGGNGGYCPIMGMVHVNNDDFCSYGAKMDGGKQ